MMYECPIEWKLLTFVIYLNICIETVGSIRNGKNAAVCKMIGNRNEGETGVLAAIADGSGSRPRAPKRFTKRKCDPRNDWVLMRVGFAVWPPSNKSIPEGPQ